MSLYALPQRLSRSTANEARIGRAYAVYYTHASGRAREERRSAGGLRSLKLALPHGYVNARYGTQRQPSSPLGVWLARLTPLRRQKRDAECRFLPRPTRGQRLLDVGCGNRDYLRHASDAGWQAVGIDADEKAVDVARPRGLEARLGGIELFAGQTACFEAITLSHVLEHLHDPERFLRAVHRLLQPGDVVFVDTPNIESHGTRRWGVHWRGLATPRQLVIFSRSALIEMLRAAGFVGIENKRRTAVRKSMDLASLRMHSGKSPCGREPARLPLRLRMRLAWPDRRIEDEEFLTLLACKGES